MNAPRTEDPSLSRGAHEVIKRMLAAEQAEDFEDAEIVQDGRECWQGHYRTSAKVVMELLRSVLLRDCGEEKGVRRYSLNEDGRKACADPTWRPPEMRGLLR